MLYCSCCPKMPQDWAEGKCAPFLPATNVFPCNMSKAQDREDGVTSARHPAPGGTLCSGCGALQPAGRYLLPWTSTSSPTLALHALVSATDSGNNNLSGARIKQDKINAGNSPVWMWGVGGRNREGCTSPVLVKRVRQSMVPALPRRRQQLGTLALMG